ncbi:MAG: alpha/beta hydrolase [Anaerolineaceae bacterium]|jgi:pimeloyl-ACP methyl ester carboxylesterase|nr:alpha/beta hydrolase [Anaerolineaceae bacterium]
MSVILINQEIVHYEVLGRGRPVIFLHSWVGSWRYWIPTLQAASTDFRAYAIDMWGFGETSRGVSGFSVDKQVDLLDQFLYQMGMGKVVLVGHGFGAIVALQFAARFPQFVDRVLTIGLPLKGELIKERLHAASSEELALLVTAQKPELAPVVEDTVKIAPEVKRDRWKDMDDRRLQELWRKCETVCLMVQGFADPIVQMPDQGLLSSLPDKSKMMIFRDSGHFPMQDESEKFHRLLAEFLSLSSGQSPRDLQLTESWRRRVR